MYVQKRTRMSPEPGAKANWKWGRVGRMLADHRCGILSSSFSLILDSSVGLSADIQSAGDSVAETLFRTEHLTEEDNLSPFDSKIACPCQSIEINNSTHVYRQSQMRKPSGSGVEWAECSLIIGTGCWVQVLAWSSIAQSVCQRAFSPILCIYVCTFACMNVFPYVCIYVYTYACIYISIYAFMCMIESMHVCILEWVCSCTYALCIYIRTPVRPYVWGLMWLGRGLNKIGAGS